MRKHDRLAYSLSLSIPMLPLIEGKDKADSKRILRRLNSYRKIFTYLNDSQSFEKIAGNLYTQLKSGRRIKDLPVSSVEKKLRARLKKVFEGVIEDLRNTGYGREADKIEDFVSKGEFMNAYRTLKELRESEKKSESIEQLLERIDEIMYDLNALRKVDSDVSEILWKMAELLGVNRVKIPDKKLVFVNDPSGNSACLISTYLKRIGKEHIYISSKNLSDYHISPRGDNYIDPNLKSGKLTEVILGAKGIVLIEDLNYLSNINGFGSVYQFLQFVKNSSRAKIIVTGSFKNFSDRETARLRGLFDATLTISTLFNICSWGMVGIRSRINRGSLLLSKELVNDYPGEVMMIADFGGERYVHPQRIDFEISDAVIRSIGEGDVVIDCIDLLIDENGIERIYTWLKSIRDAALENGNRVYVVVSSLIGKEREYIRPILDTDIFSISKVDEKVIEAVSKKMDIIEKLVRRAIEKECAYNMEVIKQKYGRYDKYLSSLKDEVEAILASGQEFNREFLLKTTPLRERIEKLVEHIESKIAEYESILEEVKNGIELVKHYVDVEDIEYCVSSAVETYEAGDADLALDKIKLCRSKLDKLMEDALKEANRINGEFQCIKELLPAYFQSKLSKFKDGVDNLKEFTHIYEDIRMVALEKVENEYNRLRKYSFISGIPLEKMDAWIHQLRFCDYWKRREEFLEEFNKSRDNVRELLVATAIKVIEFLEKHGYTPSVSREEIQRTRDFERLFSKAERVFNHLSMYISKSIEDVKKRYPEFVEENQREVERILVSASINPSDALERYEIFMEKLRRAIGERDARAIELKRKLQEYYDLLRSYGVPVREWYPKELEKAEMGVEIFQSILGELNPDVDVSIDDIYVDENYTCHIFLSVTNKGNHEAKNVSFEIYGAINYQEKIGTLSPGEEKHVDISAKVSDPDEDIKVDLFFEGVGGEMVTTTFSFTVNLRGYTISESSGSERCVYCRGKIPQGMEMVVCSECGATYHKPCAQRLKTCKICGNVFII